MGTIARNTLFYGDNLNILRDYISDESIDLIYLDPPFNSNRTYNVLFKDESGFDSQAQITAFDDAWHWGEQAEETYYHLVNNSSPEIATMIGALRQFIGTNQMMAYLVMMSIRLIELHRILKPTGSIYLHCDPTTSHYLKIILDTILSPNNFINEVIWRRQNSKSLAFNRYASNHDVIFRYSKSNNWIWNPTYKDYSEAYLNNFYKYIEEGTGRRYRLSDITNPNKDRPNLTYEFLGINRVWRWTKSRMQRAYEDGRIVQKNEKSVPQFKRYLDEQKGVLIDDIWDDINPIQSQAIERLGYPTQKPIALIERIIQASSNPGDIVLDPFSGCGTAIAAAQKLNRKWIGIDITYLAIALHKNRLKDMYGIEAKKDYDVFGEPESIPDAKQLAHDNRYQFQWWALSLIDARPVGDNKKGSDKGIDGIITFTDDPGGKVKKILVQVKSGHVNSGLIRDFRGTMEREANAELGVFITLDNPTKDMDVEALEAGYYVSPVNQKKYLKIQILTIVDLFNGLRPDLPQTASYSTFRKAGKVNKSDLEQGELNL